MNRKRTILFITLGLALIAGIWYAVDRINYSYRQQWHGPIRDMQDLPPLDRSQWPATPTAWTTQPVEVVTATPTGEKRIPVTYFINSLGMKFVAIQPGTFIAGLPDDVAKAIHRDMPDGPMYTQHEIHITKSYFIAAFEVTNEQFAKFTTGHKSDNLPAQPVTWRQAQEFCRWLSQKEGHLYRLPTEAEWEYACHAGTTNRTYWGENTADRTKANLGGGNREKHEGWRDDGFEYAAPVGSFPANPWGLYDMIGNSREWVADWYAPYSTNALTDPTGPATGNCRVMKSGGWNTSLKNICSAFRDGDAPHDAKDNNGFRILCEVP